MSKENNKVTVSDLAKFLNSKQGNEVCICVHGMISTQTYISNMIVSVVDGRILITSDDDNELYRVFIIKNDITDIEITETNVLYNISSESGMADNVFIETNHGDIELFIGRD